MSADLGSSVHRAAKWTPRTLAALRGPTAWKSEVPQALGRFKVCRDMETASSPDLGSGFETPQVPENCELVCIVMETPSSPRSGIVESPAFPSCRKMRKPVVPSRAGHGNPEFPRLGHQGATWKPRVSAGLGAAGFGRGVTWKPQVSLGLGVTWEPPASAGLGAAGFGRGATWKPQVSAGLGAAGFGRGATWKPQKILRRAETPNFRRDKETPNFIYLFF